VTAGADGFVKTMGADLKLLKSYFITNSGISGICQLGYSADQFALASHNNNVYLFNLFSGTVSQYFYAHDAAITALLCCDDLLVSVSLDFLVKIWDLKAGQLREPKHTLFEHEAPVLAADLLPKSDQLVSADQQGQVLLRCIKQPETITDEFNPLQAPCKTACVLFSSLTDVFVAFDATLFAYRRKDPQSPFKLLASHTVVSPIQKLRQDLSLLVLLLKDGRIVLYDWNDLEQKHEFPDFAVGGTDL
jgi:WD40 repeat protein